MVLEPWWMAYISLHHKWNVLNMSPERRMVLRDTSVINFSFAWWRHQMETFSALLALCAGNSPVPGEFPAQRPVTRSFHVFFLSAPE